MNYRLPILILISVIFSVANSFGQKNQPKPPVTPDLPASEEEVFKVVEQMPRFPGCELVEGNDKKKETCAKEKMLEYIYSNLQYPTDALENEIEGMAVIQFVIQKDGSIADIKAVRNPGAGTGEEGVRIVSSMNDMEERWTPGHQWGKPVKVQYTLPVKFKIEEIDRPQLENDSSDSDFEYVYNLDQEPLFPGCRRKKNSNCTTTSLLEFVKDNQLYPDIALENKTEGIVQISFIIEIDGTLTDIKARTQLPNGLSEDAVEIFEWMNKEEMRWTPGKKNHKKVRTLFRWDVAYDLASWERRN